MRRGRQRVHMIMICGGEPAVSEETRKSWRERDDGDILNWHEIWKTRRYYEHYRSVLEGDVDDNNFTTKVSEVARTREVLNRGSVVRGSAERKRGLGEQDVDFLEGAPPDLQRQLRGEPAEEDSEQ